MRGSSQHSNTIDHHARREQAECAERLATSASRTGIRRLLLMVEGTGELPHTLDTIARLGTEVAPCRTGQHR